MKPRKLKTPDVFAACRLLKEIGAKDHISKVVSQLEGTQEIDMSAAGFDIVWALFEGATEKNAEKKIYEFLSGPFQITPAEVEELDLEELFEGLKQIAAENNLKNFFKSAANLMK